MPYNDLVCKLSFSVVMFLFYCHINGMRIKYVNFDTLFCLLGSTIYNNETYLNLIELKERGEGGVKEGQREEEKRECETDKQK